MHIDKTQKCCFLTNSRRIKEGGEGVIATWMQRINQKCNIVGIGYFTVDKANYTKGAGMCRRIINYSRKGDKK